MLSGMPGSSIKRGEEPGDEGDGDLDSRDAAELLPIDNDLYQQEISVHHLQHHHKLV